MKTFAVAMALGATLFSTAAVAADQRPAAAPFVSAPQPVPATPSVAKRKGLKESSTLLTIGGIAAAGAGVAILSGAGNGNNASPQ